MDKNNFYAVIREKKLSPDVTAKTITEFSDDHKVSDDERNSRLEFIKKPAHQNLLHLIVSRTAYFSSIVLEDRAEESAHDLEDVYHALNLNLLVGEYSKLAKFTFSSFVELKLSKNFTITPKKRLIISTVSRALEKQSIQIITADESALLCNEF